MPQANENLFVCKIHTKLRDPTAIFSTQVNGSIRIVSEQGLSQVELARSNFHLFRRNITDTC